MNGSARGQSPSLFNTRDVRASDRTPNSYGLFPPFDMARDALHDFQNGPKMQRPNLAESFIPVVGPAWEAAADLQDGNYAGAAFNGGMAVLDALPVGVAAKGLRAASKGIGLWEKGGLKAWKAAKNMRKAGLVKKGQEVHHTIELNGTRRDVLDWRNQYPFLKVMDQATHRRLRGNWPKGADNKFGTLGRIWHGTNDWQRALPAGIAGYSADALENVTHPFAEPLLSPNSDDGRAR